MRRSLAWVGRVRVLVTARRPASWVPRSRDGRVALGGLLLILVAGAIMRLLFLLAWRPAFFGFPDTVSYVGLALEKLWVDPTREVGYPSGLGDRAPARLRARERRSAVLGGASRGRAAFAGVAPRGCCRAQR